MLLLRATGLLLALGSLSGCIAYVDDVFGEDGGAAGGGGAASGSTTSAGTTTTGSTTSTGATTTGSTTSTGATTTGSTTGAGGAGPTCGNGDAEVGEVCDGADLAGHSCQEFGFTNPNGLVCDDCQLVSSGCASTCNGVALEAGEVCDGTHLNGATCTMFGFVNPAGLVCTGCALNPAGCQDVCDCDSEFSCANQTCIPAAWRCDGFVDCIDGSDEPPINACAAPDCGDGVLQLGEQCDDGNLCDGDGCNSTCKRLICDVGQVAVSIAATDLPQTIVDNMPAAPALSNVTVTQIGTVAKLAIHVRAAHNWIGDAEFHIDPPAVAQIALADNIGGAGDNMDAVFSSVATTNITTGTPPWTGVWAPQSPFTSVIGSQANGIWTLKALDNVGGIPGTLTGFSLYLCVQP